MKIITFKTTKNSSYEVGVIDSSGERVIPLISAASWLGIKSVQELIMCWREDLKEKLQGVIENKRGDFALTEIIKASPIPHPSQEIICLGINYLDHAKESAKFKKEDFDGKRENAVYFGDRKSVV